MKSRYLAFSDARARLPRGRVGSSLAPRIYTAENLTVNRFFSRDNARWAGRMTVRKGCCSKRRIEPDPDWGVIR